MHSYTLKTMPLACGVPARAERLQDLLTLMLQCSKEPPVALCYVRVTGQHRPCPITMSPSTKWDYTTLMFARAGCGQDTLIHQTGHRQALRRQGSHVS